MLSVFLTLQVLNKPYFSPRANFLRALTIIACIGYCACRVIISGLGQIYYGGQLNPGVDLNIQIPNKHYEYTRGYINLESDTAQFSI